VAADHFYDRYPGRYRLRSHEVNTVYNRTTVINNITVDNRNRVVNRGIDPRRVEAVTRQPIRQVAVRDVQRERFRSRTGQGTRDVTATGRLAPTGRTTTTTVPTSDGTRRTRDRTQSPTVSPSAEVPVTGTEVERTGRTSERTRGVTTTPVTPSTTPAATRPTANAVTAPKQAERQPLRTTPNTTVQQPSVRVQPQRTVPPSRSLPPQAAPQSQLQRPAETRVQTVPTTPRTTRSVAVQPSVSVPTQPNTASRRVPETPKLERSTAYGSTFSSRSGNVTAAPTRVMPDSARGSVPPSFTPPAASHSRAAGGSSGPPVNAGSGRGSSDRGGDRGARRDQP
jgi:hypothetical protein